MQKDIAVVYDIQGDVCAINVLGEKRALSSGDSLYLNDLVRTSVNGSVELKIDNGDLLMLEALQSLKLSADISPLQLLDKADAILDVDLPHELVVKLFSSCSMGDAGILAEVEPVYLYDKIETEKVAPIDSVLTFSDILQASADLESLDNFLRFDEKQSSTVVYFSHSGQLVDSESAPLYAEKILTIDSTGYQSSAQLLSFLIDNHLFVDSV